MDDMQPRKSSDRSCGEPCFASNAEACYNESVSKKQTIEIEIVPLEAVANRILIIRQQRVMLDSDLAALYGVPTKALNQAVKRNSERFPEDYMFRLDASEIDLLNRSQIVTGSAKHRDPRFAPYAFTEHGAIMAATILNSPEAVAMSVFVVRAFVRLRELLASNKELAAQFRKLEQRLEQRLDTSDAAMTELYKLVRRLMNPPEPRKQPIGF
jgi:ORF6N domain